MTGIDGMDIGSGGVVIGAQPLNKVPNKITPIKPGYFFVVRLL